MSARPCCRSCRHCQPAADSSWCRLRKVTLHPDLTADLSCHHWTPKPPELPDWVPDPVYETICRAHAREPEHRFSDVTALAAALSGLAAALRRDS